MRIRTRILLAFLLIGGAGLGALVYWVQTELRPRYLEAQEEPLVDMAHLLAELLREELQSPAGAQASLGAAFERLYQRRFDARIYNLQRDRADIRVYLTDANGRVVFDSAGADVGKDYSRWNDVYRALRREYGARSTADDPANPEATTAYVAAPVLDDAGRVLGVVSVGKPKRNLGYFVAEAQRELFIAALAALAVTLLLAFVLYFWVSLPLQQLTAYAQKVKAGERAVLPSFGRDEIGRVARAVEEMQTALDGKEYIERYVQTLTHELKSPLAAIRAAGELLREPLPAGQRERFLANIAGETARLQAFVDRLLQLAALEKRGHLERPETLDVAQLVQEVIGSQQPLLAARQVGLQLRIAPGARWRGERFLLRQAIENLVRNALDFSPPAGRIEISAAAGDPSTLVIRDHGPGIPEYALPRLFERFYSHPRPDGSKGTGLGLNFAREVAQLHGGELRVANHPEGGVEARLSLPAG